MEELVILGSCNIDVNIYLFHETEECHQMCSKHDEDTVTNLTIPVAVFPKYVREILAIGGFEDQFQVQKSINLIRLYDHVAYL